MNKPDHGAELLAKLSAEMPNDGLCCFGFFGGMKSDVFRCKRVAYYVTVKDGTPTALVWCAKHKPKYTDASTTLEHRSAN